MPEPRISVLIVAKNEAHNLADCLRAASWADERVVVVDRGSQDATYGIAKSLADVVILRSFDGFAGRAPQLARSRLRSFGRLGDID